VRRVPLILFLLIVAVAIWLARPLPRTGLESDPHPAPDYASAVRIVDSLRAAETNDIASECGTRLMTHGGPTHRVIVLFHGLTNCPQQFDSLGRMSFARGANVLIPRLPHHGLADRMTEDLARMNAPELRAFADRVLDAAHGLGDSVTVAGLSVGGTLVMWAAQYRPDVDRAVLIAPMIGIAAARGRRTPIVARLATDLPNLFMWWDPRKRENLPGPQHVYPRFSSRSIASALDLGWTTLSDARRAPPHCRSLAVITVGGDMAVDNQLNRGLVAAWRKVGKRTVETYEFPVALHLNHDVVDPEQIGGNPAITYPVLTRFIGP
jgi:pimeloyl-ACP methyl ester carboxylesterase